METTNKNNDFGLIYPSDFLRKCSSAIKDVDLFLEEFLPFKIINQSTPANIAKTENGVTLEMIIPGYDKKEIDISLEKNTLTVSGKKELSKQEYSRKEFSYNSFSRSFNLSEQLDLETVKSSLNNGILTISINKLNPESVKTEKKKITVE